MRIAHTEVVLDLGWLSMISHGNRDRLCISQSEASGCMDLARLAYVQSRCTSRSTLVLRLYCGR